MRLFEILMLAAILPLLVWPLLPWRRPKWIDFLPGTAVLLMIIQFIVEGYRWQMLPAYLLVVLLFLLTLPRLRSSSSQEKKWSGWAIAAAGCGLLLWLAALALAYLLPVPRLPDPSGPYAIGTQTFHLVDERRDEIYTDDPADKREIMVQLWYPADPDAPGEAAVYLEDLDLMGPVLAQRLGLPSFFLDHINLVKLDALKDVPVLDNGAPFPVLVFSHGLRGMRVQNTAVVRELVSQGFVVATIDHTFGNVLTVFPDGRVASYNRDTFSGKGDPPHTGNTLLGVWAGDIGTVLDRLAAWNAAEGSRFNGRFDLARVGVFGHSTGGGATLEFCGRDARCQAAVMLDAWVEPVSEEIVGDGLVMPFLFMRADEWVSADSRDNFDLADTLFGASAGRGYLATTAGAAHFDFSDMPLFSPLTPQLGLSSTLDSDYVVEMVTSMTSAFFRQELQGEGENLLHRAMMYPQISIMGNGR